VVTGTPDEWPRVVLPVGQRIAFDLESPDVIHSFWVPEFLIKRDVVPGRTNRIELTIEEPGTYAGACGEFCGLLHHRMRFSIDAVSAAEFEAWLAGGGAGSP
jgi:cytochrome c oxidase subunit 2